MGTRITVINSLYSSYDNLQCSRVSKLDFEDRDSTSMTMRHSKALTKEAGEKAAELVAALEGVTWRR